MSAELRQEGNDLYKSHSYEEALRFYLRALQCDDVREADKAKLHNNLAACYLKLKKYQNVVTNADLCEFVFVIFILKLKYYTVFSSLKITDPWTNYSSLFIWHFYNVSRYFILLSAAVITTVNDHIMKELL